MKVVFSIIFLILIQACSNNQAENNKSSSKKSSTSSMSRALSSLRSSPSPTTGTQNGTGNSQENSNYYTIEAWTLFNQDDDFETQRDQEASISGINCSEGQVVAFKYLLPGMRIKGRDASKFNPSCAQDLFNLDCEFSRRAINVFDDLQFIIETDSTEQRFDLQCL